MLHPWSLHLACQPKRQHGIRTRSNPKFPPLIFNWNARFLSLPDSGNVRKFGFSMTPYPSRHRRLFAARSWQNFQAKNFFSAQPASNSPLRTCAMTRHFCSACAPQQNFFRHFFPPFGWNETGALCSRSVRIRLFSPVYIGLFPQVGFLPAGARQTIFFTNRFRSPAASGRPQPVAKSAFNVHPAKKLRYRGSDFPSADSPATAARDLSGNFFPVVASQKNSDFS